MADTFEQVFDYSRVEPIVDSRGVMTTKFAQTLTLIINNSNSVGDIIDDESLAIESITGGVNASQINENNKQSEDNLQLTIKNNLLISQIAEKNKTIEDINNQLVQKTNELAIMAEMQKQINDLRELIAHVS